MKGDEPAFPSENALGKTKGMDVRLWLAAQAMQGLLANPKSSNLSEEQLSLCALAYADEMLKQSEVGR